MTTNPITAEFHYSELELDHKREYQRAIDPKRVQRMIKEFRPSGLGIFTVSLRGDGRMIIIDGQHRFSALQAMGWEGKLTCNLYTELTIAEEAAMFLVLNDSKPVPALEKFQARVTSYEPVAVELATILYRYGWDVNAGSHTGCFGAVTALERVYSGAGVTKGKPRIDLVDVVLATITNAWGNDPRGVHNLLVGGLGQFYARQAGAEADKTIKALAKLTPYMVIAKARSLHHARGGSMASAVAEVTTGLYNSRRSSGRLADWRWS